MRTTVLHKQCAKGLPWVWLLLLTLIAVPGCAKEEPPVEQPVRAMKWLQVNPLSAGQQRAISGVVKAADTTDLSFEIGGNVLQVHVRLGDQVRKGQKLIELDQQPFSLAVREAQADLANAKAKYGAANQSYNRTKLLYEAANASKAQLDEITAQVESAKSQIEAAKARLDLAKRNLRKAVIHAPFDGSISVRQVEPFEQVNPGKRVLALDSEARMKVEVQVPETLISEIKRGQTVNVRFPTMPEAKSSGTVKEVGTRASSGNAFPVKVYLQKILPGLHPGMTAEVTFKFSGILGAEKGLMVPIAALLAGSDNQHFVFVYDEASSTVTKTPAQVRELRNNKVELGSGIQAGDIIAAAGVEFLADKQQVTLLKVNE